MLLVCPVLLAQSAKLATQVPTFHVRGTIKDSAGGAVREATVRVTFQGEKLSLTVPTNEAGIYNVDLPLGVYTMTANGSGGCLGPTADVSFA